jgi:hypothetical protein
MHTDKTRVGPDDAVNDVDGSGTRLMTASQISQIKEEARLDLIAAIRDNFRHLPVARHGEAFSDFDGAVKSGTINFLADIVVNWALGGHGFEYAGDIVNRALDDLPDLSEDPELLAAWQEYKDNRLNGDV